MNMDKLPDIDLLPGKNGGTPSFSLFIGLIFFVFTIATNLHAEIYKWIDKDGNVQFGDKPGKDVQAEQVKIKESSPVSTDPESQKRREAEEKLLKVMVDDREQEEEEKRLAKEKTQKDKETRKRNCAQARDYKRTLDASGPIYDLDEEGNRVYLSEEENKAERQRAEEMVKQWCG